MRLSDFESHIEDRILQRGLGYYHSGAILSVTQEIENTYEAIVEGTENYFVTVNLASNGEILFSQCDCPYDMGPVCKHEVAVYYALRKMKEDKHPTGTVINIDEYAKKKNSFEKESPANRFQRILSSLSKEELVMFLTSISIDYPDIGNRVELKYSSDTEEQEIKNCIALIHSYIDRHSDRHGFISYDDAFEAMEGARLIMERAEEAMDGGQYIRAVNLFLCVIREVMPLLNHSDDSDGYIGSTIEEAVSLLSNIMEYEIPQNIMSDIFEKLLREAIRKYFDEFYDWRLDLLGACAYLAITPALRNRLEKELDSLIEKRKDSWTSKYYEERVADIRYSLILNFDGKSKALEFLESNLKYPNFRIQAINKAISDKDYTHAEKLALNGEEKDKEFAGLVNEWKKYRYEAYSHSGQLDKQRQLALEFVMKGDFDFYKKLKETYPKEEWHSVYTGIIKSFEEKKRYNSIYEKILIEEKEVDKLLAYVKANPETIITYYKHLLPVHKEEVYKIFVFIIQHEAKNASSRNEYKRVCDHIRLLSKSGGVEQARELIVNLTAAYPRRPALKDELGRIKLPN